MKKERTEASCRLGRVGGEAVIEGVMMKSGEQCATACRKEDGSIVVSKQRFVSIRKKKKFLNIPILRGVVNFIETMRLSMRSLNVAADALGINDEEEGRFEKWLKKHLGVRATDLMMGVAAVLGVALALFLFMYLPAAAAKGIAFLANHVGDGVFDALPERTRDLINALVEGFFKITIFVSYIALVSLMPDIRRTFEYHGAEHKSIACFESGEDLTPENAKKHTRFHPRCGTSFMFVMILIGIIIGFFIPASLPVYFRSGIKLLLLPFVVGIGYEFIMFAGKHQNFLVRALSAPGLLMQRLTTREPDESQLEIAITALKMAMPEEFPDFDASHITVTDLDTGVTVTPAEKPASDESAAEEEASSEAPATDAEAATEA